MAISEEDDRSKKADQEFHAIIAKKIEMDDQVSRELDEKGIKPELDGEEDYYKANKEWFNREVEKLRKKYGVELKK